LVQCAYLYFWLHTSNIHLYPLSSVLHTISPSVEWKKDKSSQYHSQQDREDILVLQCLVFLFQLVIGRMGLCCAGCCAYGICHPALWNSYCCPLALAGQVMSRLKLTWTANEGTSAQALATFRILLGISIAFVVADNILFLYPSYFHEMPKDPYNKYENEQYREYVMRFGFCRMVLRVIFNLFAVYVVWKTRAYIREKYSIPARCCGECEDCCCSFWCTCCTIGQMARHTADYETYAAICCNDTGLPSHVPNIV
jgi:Cys-rich protein (TIGR01571 family)